MRRRQIWALGAQPVIEAGIEATPEPLADTLIPQAAIGDDRNACPKCGRMVKQGKYLHVKHCKGKK